MSELTTAVGKLLKGKSPDVWHVSASDTVFHSIEMMAAKQVGALLVMEHGELLGIISERDYARKVILQGRSSKETPVADIMSSPVTFVSPQSSVGECMSIVTRKRIRHLPVVENNKVVGIISIGDLVNWIITEQEHTIRHLEAYISGATA